MNGPDAVAGPADANKVTFCGVGDAAKTPLPLKLTLFAVVDVIKYEPPAVDITFIITESPAVEAPA